MGGNVYAPEPTTHEHRRVVSDGISPGQKFHVPEVLASCKGGGLLVDWRSDDP